jgi:rubrerythrin
MSEYSAELYVHAIAIETEAARRYGELAQAMAARGNHAVAELFRRLGAFEERHLEELRRRTAGQPLPPLDADYTWPGEAPETVTLALALALGAEKRARAFFEHAARMACDAETLALAREMAAEEAEHALAIERMRSREAG